MAVHADCVAMLQGAYSHSLAEWALTACSWFAKDLPRLKQQQKDRNWEPYYVEELRQAIQLCQAQLLLFVSAVKSSILCSIIMYCHTTSGNADIHCCDSLYTM